MNQQSVNLTNHSSIAVKANNRGVLVIPVTGKPHIPTPAQSGTSGQGVATLVVMCCVLFIIMLFCCLAAPGIRDLCKRYVFRKCVIDDPEVNNVWTRRQELENQFKIISEKEQRRSSRGSEHRQSRRQSSRPL